MADALKQAARKAPLSRTDIARVFRETTGATRMGPLDEEFARRIERATVEAMAALPEPEAVQVPQGLVPGWNWLTHPDWNDGELTPAWVEFEGSEAWYSPAEVQNLTQFSWAERNESWEIAAAPQPPAQASSFDAVLAEFKRSNPTEYLAAAKWAVAYAEELKAQAEAESASDDIHAPKCLKGQPEDDEGATCPCTCGAKEVQPQAEARGDDWTIEDVGRAMVGMTTTVHGRDEWSCIPDLWRRCMEERDALRSRAEAAPQAGEAERHLRRMLAARVAMPHAYYDDGEAQGSEHGIAIDFMRESVQDIDAKLRALNIARAECASQPMSRDERAELERLRKLVNTPTLHIFRDGVVLEAAHQRERWGSEHDAGKTPADWFWLVGYLAGKALHAQTSGDTEKALHHTISTAAALANWHASITGEHTAMRPGIDPAAHGIGSGAGEGVA